MKEIPRKHLGELRSAREPKTWDELQDWSKRFRMLHGQTEEQAKAEYEAQRYDTRDCCDQLEDGGAYWLVPCLMGWCNQVYCICGEYDSSYGPVGCPTCDNWQPMWRRIWTFLRWTFRWPRV